jgi:DNA-binding response OmpR family regulator
MRPRGRVLVVEDEALIALSLADMLESMGFTVCGTADNVRSAVDMADRDAPDLVLMDIRLRGKGDGIDAARQICERRAGSIGQDQEHSCGYAVDKTHSSRAAEISR